MAVTLAFSKASARKNTSSSGEKLRGGRGAPGAMERKGIAWGGGGGRKRTRGSVGGGGERATRGGRRRGMVGGGAVGGGGGGPFRMLGDERAARRKIEQRGASQQRQRVAHNRSPENGYA